jgi:hypothetical protein
MLHKRIRLSVLPHNEELLNNLKERILKVDISTHVLGTVNKVIIVEITNDNIINTIVTISQEDRYTPFINV